MDEITEMDMHHSQNVLGTELATCSKDPVTGWFRDGCCNTNSDDQGYHTVCCILTETFLNFAKSLGNDLMTPAPQFNFPGLKPGDQWCVCAPTWKAAAEAGNACPVNMEATHERTLEVVPLEMLELYAQ